MWFSVWVIIISSSMLQELAFNIVLINYSMDFKYGY
jgi:hypothetical protein